MVGLGEGVTISIDISLQDVETTVDTRHRLRGQVMRLVLENPLVLARAGQAPATGISA